MPDVLREVKEDIHWVGQVERKRTGGKSR